MQAVVPVAGAFAVASADGTRTTAHLPESRLVVWSAASAGLLPHRPRQTWDLAVVHGLLHGGRREDPAAVWAGAHSLPEPLRGADDLTLLDTGLGVVEPYAGAVRADGTLHPDAERQGSPQEWAVLALQVQAAQEQALRALPDPRPDPSGPPLRLVTAWAESAAAVLCTELAADGLPIDVAEARRIIGASVGPDSDRAFRDRPVLALLGDDHVDLRSPFAVRDLLLRRGIDVPDTRSWRLDAYRANPLVAALLAWRKAERLATTYGYGWLEEHVRDGRLRGEWTSCDGGAGRMTASAGLHSLPAELRPAVAAEPGHVLLRADLGQVEPRVLAAVSGDRGFARAAAADDLYTPVATSLGVDRPTAKVAVLAAMYGQTSGAAGQALGQMEKAYPVALAFLRAAEESGRVGQDVRTHGGRLIRTGHGGVGRFARNAVVQGAAAELFKAWAAAVRGALLVSGAGQVVLCLHDELVLHVVEDRAGEVADLLRDVLQQVSDHWASGSGVRFVADVSAVRRWSDAKS